MESHSDFASAGEEVERRWLKRVLMASFSEVLLEGMRRTRRPGPRLSDNSVDEE
jgi:hypothetical protein